MSIEILEKLTRKATINISKTEINTMRNDKLKKYGQKVKLKGFRPGKAPAKMIEGMYGADAFQEAVEYQIRNKFADLIEKNQLNLAAAPKVDLLSDDAEQMVFSAIFEVMPEVVIGNLAETTIAKPSCTINDADVDEMIEALLNREATYSDAPIDKTAANGDQVTIDFSGTLDGVKFAGGSASDFVFILGQGKMLPDFENGIIGLKASAKVTVLVNFPADYHAENLKNKQTVFEITLKKIEIAEIPTLDAELIRKFGATDGSEATLRQQLKNSMEQIVQERLKAKLRDNALDALVAVSPLHVPNAWVHEEIHHMMHDTEERMKQQGYAQDQIKLTHEMFHAQAHAIVTRRLLVQKFIQEQQLSVNDDDIKTTLEHMANMYNVPIDIYMNLYKEDNKNSQTIKAMVMEEKVIQQIIALAKTENQEISYQELMRS